MRSQLLIVVLVLACAVAALVWMTHNSTRSLERPQPETTEPAAAENVSQPIAEGESIPPTPQKREPSPRASAARSNASGQAAPGPVALEHEAQVEKRVAELQDLGMENDAESLKTILSELHNEDRAIRDAAVEAAIQFGSRDAIPELTQAAEQTTDPEAKAAILEAIDFLKMPTLSEVLAQTNRPPANPSSTR